MGCRFVCWCLFSAMAASAAPTILVHGHRGARAVRPENTIPAFQYAISVGVDVLELDLAVTRDNVVVVSHDLHINRKICEGPEGETAIRKLTYEEVQQWDCGAKKNPEFPKQQTVPGTRIPRLDDVLVLADKGSFEFNVETKTSRNQPALNPEPAEYARLVVDVIRRRRLEKRVIIQSFDFRTLHEVKRLAPEIRLSALYAGAPKDFLKLAEEAGGASIVSPHYVITNRESVRRAHQKGLQVVPWTANTPRQWDALIKSGVDAIITDDPAALIEYLKQKGLR